jgi:hypothetical protein
LAPSILLHISEALNAYKSSGLHGRDAREITKYCTEVCDLPHVYSIMLFRIYRRRCSSSEWRKKQKQPTFCAHLRGAMFYLLVSRSVDLNVLEIH